MNWQSDLRSQLSRQNDELVRLKALVDRLRQGSDQEATEILARLRLGDSIEDLTNSIGLQLQDTEQ